MYTTIKLNIQFITLYRGVIYLLVGELGVGKERKEGGLWSELGKEWGGGGGGGVSVFLLVLANYCWHFVCNLVGSHMNS